MQAPDWTPTSPTIGTVEIPNRGTPLVWEAGRGQGAPALVLLHGVTMTAELGWSLVFDRLARDYHVVAPDLRGHGDGIPSGGRFSLEACADDVAALADALGLRRIVVVGYSMGGMVAQLLWKRHRPLVAGLVLCATARNVRGSPAERLFSLALPAITSGMLWHPATHLLTSQGLGGSVLGHIEDDARRAWARRQLDRTSLPNAMLAVQAVSEFTSHDWIGALDVPMTSVVTTKDRLVPAGRQRRLAAAVPHATVIELDADHGVCIQEPGRFGEAIASAAAMVLAQQS